MASASPISVPLDVSDVPLAAVLSAVAQELDLIVELGERTQSALSPVLLGLRASAPMGAQELDSLVQHAHGLATFVAALAHACPSDWSAAPAGAAEGLRLRAQKLRLSSPGASSEPSSSSPSSGALELL